MTRNAEGEKADSKRDQLAELLRQRAARSQLRRVSPGQQRVLRLARLNPADTHFNLIAAYRLAGPLKRSDVRPAVEALAARHDILRATFPAADGGKFMKIRREQEAPVPIIELDLSQHADPEEMLLSLVAQEASRPFDFEQEPLWRFMQVTLAPSDHAIVLNMHHAISDGRSFEVFFQELRQLYAAGDRDGGANAILPPTAMTYADYAERQLDFIGGALFEEQLEGWRLRFQDPAMAPALPEARADANLEDRAAAAVRIELPPETTASLAELGRREGATVFMTLIAGLQAALMRTSGQEDMVISVPVSGRHRARTRDVIGYFNNILPVRLDGRDDPTFLDLLARARRDVLASFKTQDVPFERIADLPGLRRASLSRLIFSLEDGPWPPDLNLDGLICRKVEGDFGSADFDVGFQLWWEQDRLVGNVRYKAAVFHRDAMARFVDLFRETLDLMVEAPDRALFDLSVPPDRTRAVTVAGAAPTGARRAPRTALEMQIARLWQEEFEQDDIAIDDSLMALGASSLAVASLLERIETQFDAKLSVGDIFKAATVEGMARTLKSRAEGAGFSPLATIKAGGDKPPLFLCEGVGIYFDLASHLRDDRPVYGLITDLTESFPSVKELAAHYAEAIRAAQPSGPYHVGGVSFGGLVAYETARLLKEQGTALGVVALLDAPAPGAYRPKPLLGKLLGHSRNLARFGLPYLKKVVKARKSKRELARDRPAQLTADGAAGDMSQARNLFRKRLRDFQPSGYAGDVALFKLKERSGMTDSLFDPALGDIDPFLGWRTYVSGDIACFELPGDHIGILREPAVRELAGHLENAFDRCEKGPG